MFRKFWLFSAVLLLALCIVFGAGAEKNGWEKEGDSLYYYSDGVKVTGLQTIGGNVFSFSENAVTPLCGERPESDCLFCPFIFCWKLGTVEEGLAW